MTIIFKRPIDGEHDPDVCARAHCSLPPQTLFTANCFGPQMPPRTIGLCDDCASIVRNEWTPSREEVCCG